MIYNQIDPTKDLDTIPKDTTTQDQPCTTDHPDHITHQIQQLKHQLDTSEDRYKRIYADYENLKKRTEREKLELEHTANLNIIKNLLTIIDDFERAFAITTKDPRDNHFSTGINLVYTKFLKLISQFQVEKITTNIGDNFDPDLHEAIASIPTQDPEMKGKIHEIVEPGYLLNNKVIRFAKVTLNQ